MPAEKIEVEVKNTRPDGLISIALEGISSIPYKQLIALFLIFIFISNDVFIDRVLAKANNSFVVYPGQTSTAGTIVQGIIVVLLFAVATILINKKIL